MKINVKLSPTFLHFVVSLHIPYSSTWFISIMLPSRIYVLYNCMVEACILMYNVSFEIDSIRSSAARLVILTNGHWKYLTFAIDVQVDLFRKVRLFMSDPVALLLERILYHAIVHWISASCLCSHCGHCF